jgi:hypothetical protein
MTKFVKVAVAAGVLALALSINAPGVTAMEAGNELRQGHAFTTELGAGASAVTYWTSESDGWRVVTTVDTVSGQEGDVEKHAVVRFSSLLLPGQSQLISVPLALGERQQALRIRRLGDRIEVARVLVPSG